MNSEVDTSILNSVNIKRFTKTVLENHGAEVDQSNSAKWQVTFPRELANRLDRENGTLVFDPADRELGAGDLLVQPGTRVFSALLDLVQQPGTVGQLRLTEDELQVKPPTVLQDSSLNVSVTDFSKRTSDFALAFHFQVQFETPSSFHSEEMFSVTIDPESGTRLPDLTARLTAHLPQLLQQNNEHTAGEIPQEKIQQAFEEAQQAVIDRSRPIVSEIRDEADETASERIAEISDWYEQRRNELDKQISEQEKEIRKWKKKRRKARKDETRRRYIKSRKEAERELEQLKQEVQQKKNELDSEESQEIDEVIERNEVDVDVSLLGVTEVTYARGTLTLNVNSSHTERDIEVSYLPATDDFQGLDCEVCSQDLTKGVLPQLCANGHLVGDPCATTCRSCGLSHCDACDSTSTFSECELCWEPVCSDCRQTCSSCNLPICADHSEICQACNATTCRLCGEACETCGDFHCDTHLTHCPDCDAYHCDAHTESCDHCDSVRCQAHVGQCNECGDIVCSDHGDTCVTCGDILCDNHIEYCTPCSNESEHSDRGFCSTHVVHCSVGDEALCSEHRDLKTVGSGQVCESHRGSCSSCDIPYADTELDDGWCSACRSIGETDAEKIPREVVDEFRSVKAGMNEAYMVILGKQLLGRNKLIVFDIQSGEEIHRHNAGMLKQLIGGY
ncbi:hypothetical protein ACFQE8_24455 [Salinirubellus sp. GCM10025818]|uniref:hypothetical protein n=1 Tax=Salinirubellus TaxID=2162630 RepID=UPI0030CD2F1F